MYKSRKRPTVNFVLRVSAEQHDELARLSKQREKSIQTLVRQGIVAVTGVPDDIKGYKPGVKP